MPVAASISGSARFQGTTSVVETRDGASHAGVASGRLELGPIALNGVTAKHGAVRLDEFRWRDSRVERFAGRVDLRDGELSRDLAYGANQWLEADAFPALVKAYEESAADTPLPFTQLACEVELDEKGLSLIAGCGEIDGQQRGGAVAHAVLEHRGDALLREPKNRQLPAWRLVRAFHASEDAALPAAATAVELARRLPTPGEASR